MLHIFFIALKVIGYIILAILCIILLILAIVLISPFRYRIAGEGNLKEKRVSGDVNLSWLLRLIRVDVRFHDMKLAWRLKVAWLTIMQDGYEEVKKKKGAKTNETGHDNHEEQDGELSGESSEQQSEPDQESDSGYGSNQGKTSTEISCTGDGSSDEIKDSGELSGENSEQQPGSDQEPDSGHGDDQREDSGYGSDQGEDSNTNTEAEETVQESSEEEKESSSEEAEKKSFDFEKFKEKILEINEKIQVPFRKIEEFQETLEEKLDKLETKYNEIIEIKDDLLAFVGHEKHKKAFFNVIHALLYIVKKYLPRKGDIHLHFGLGDPYATGVAFAVLSVLDPLTGGNIYATPEAEEWMLEGSLSIKGHIRLIHIPIAVLRLLISPAIWRTVLDARKLKILKR